MKNFLILAAIAIGVLTSCNKKVNTEENTEIKASETTEQVQVMTDTVNQVDSDSVAKSEQAKVDPAHGHTH